MKGSFGKAGERGVGLFAESVLRRIGWQDGTKRRVS